MVETRFDPYPYLEVSQINGHIRTSLLVTGRFDPYPHISGSAHTDDSAHHLDQRGSTNTTARCPLLRLRSQPMTGVYPPVDVWIHPEDNQRWVHTLLFRCDRRIVYTSSCPCSCPGVLSSTAGIDLNSYPATDSAEVSSVKHSFEGLFRSD